MAVEPTLCIGIGNRYRRDDGVGPFIARRLAARGPRGLRVEEASGEGAALIEALDGAARAILFDAVSSGAAPGTVHRIEAHEQPVPGRFFAYSTHAFSVAEAIELARALGRLPPRLTLFGVEGGDFGAGDGLTAAVAEAAETVVAATLELVNAEAAPCTKPA